MIIYFGGEDEVTRAIAKKLASEIAGNLQIGEVVIEDVGIRERGTAVKSKLQQLEFLGRTNPVIFVFDSDGDCVIDILKKSCPKGWGNSFCALNLAVDEGETWLLADKKGFSSYFAIDINAINFLQDDEGEIEFPYKTSLFIMRNLIPKSTKKEVVNSMTCTERGKKPPTYNVYWKKYIEDVWNMEEARKQSKSLAKAIERVENRLKAYSCNNP